MSYKILPTREFEKDFKKLDKNFQERIKKKINEVVENPERYKHLHYDLKKYCRIRIGKVTKPAGFNPALKCGACFGFVTAEKSATNKPRTKVRGFNER